MPKDNLYRLQQLEQNLLELLGDEEAVDQWMHTSLPVLDNDTPLARILEGDIQSVIDIVAELESGIVA